MPLPESRKLPSKIAGPFIGTWKRLVAVLTGSSAVAAFTLWGVYGSLGGELAPPTKILIVGLVVAVALVIALIDQLRQYSRRYQEAVAPLYKHHPTADEGIDVQSISTYSYISGIGRKAIDDSRDVRIRVEPMAGKVLFFVCVGDVKSVTSYLEPVGTDPADPTKDPRRVPNRILTPTMFEVDLKGEPGNLRLLIDPKDVCVATVEWSNANV